MKILLYIAMIFISIRGLAQDFDLQLLQHKVLEEPRSEVVVYASQEEAVEGNHINSKYFIPIEKWTESSIDGVANFTAQFTPPFAWLNRQAFIHVGYASMPYSILINGEQIAQYSTGSLPIDFNITPYLKDGANSITISLESCPDVVKLESWNMVKEAIIDDVYIQSQPTIAVRDIITKTTLVKGNLNAEVGLVVKSYALNKRVSTIHYRLLSPAGKLVTEGSKQMNLEMKEEDTLRFVTTIPDTLAWSADSPTMYTLIAKSQENGRYLEYQHYKIGFRSLEFSRNGEMVINGEPEELRAIEGSLDMGIAEMWKLKDSGYNTIRLRAGRHNGNVYRVADLLGMYVIAPTPINTSKSGETILRGGNPTNDPSQCDEFVKRANHLYHSTRLHPSVIGFSIAEESLNGNNLYESYLHLKSLEKERPIIYLEAGSEWNNDQLKIRF